MERYGCVGEGIRSAILNISDDRTAYRRQLGANLMVPSGMEVDLQKRLPLGRLSHRLIFEYRLLCLLCPLRDRVALILISIAKESVCKGRSRALRATFDEGEVDLLKVVSPAECVIKSGECLAGSGKEYHPAHRSIEPVYHSEEDGAGLVVLLLNIGFAGLHKWFITGAIPLDDLTGSLGDSEQMVVLVEYLHGSESHAATDLQRLSGDVGGVIREEEGDCSGNILWSTCPTERDLCRPCLGLLLA